MFVRVPFIQPMYYSVRLTQMIDRISHVYASASKFFETIQFTYVSAASTTIVNTHERLSSVLRHHVSSLRE